MFKLAGMVIKIESPSEESDSGVVIIMRKMHLHNMLLSSNIAI